MAELSRGIKYEHQTRHLLASSSYHIMHFVRRYWLVICIILIVVHLTTHAKPEYYIVIFLKKYTLQWIESEVIQSSGCSRMWWRGNCQKIPIYWHNCDKVRPSKKQSEVWKMKKWRSELRLYKIRSELGLQNCYDTPDIVGIFTLQFGCNKCLSNSHKRLALANTCKMLNVTFH
jgi:hypothetical protein